MKRKFATATIAFSISLIAFVISLNAQSIEPKTVETVKAVLRKVRDNDQAMRKEIHEKTKIYKPNSPEIKTLWDKQNKNDAENQKIVTEILEKYGWPKVSDYGNNGPAEVVFLVIQHAGLEYQKRYFELARTAAECGDLMKSSFALLEDRILIEEGKKQIYGSQVRIDQKTGKPSFYPIKDEVNVDKRRAEVGLQPISEYAKFFGIEYKPPGR